MHEGHETRAWFSQRSIRNALLLVCVGVFCLMPQAHGDAPPVKEKLHVTELLKDVGIIGKLGYPLGTLLTVRGTWSVDKKKTFEGTSFFEVATINGENAPPGIEFAVVFSTERSVVFDGVHVTGDWELCCYEEGTFSGEPATLREEHKKVSKWGDILTSGGSLFGFHTQLIYLKKTRK